MDAEQLIIVKQAVQASQDAFIQAAAAKRNDTELARLLNLPTAFIVWRHNVPTDELLSCIKLAFYTPEDAATGTLLFQNRAAVCELKQNSLRLLLQRTSLTTQRLSTRQDLTDALTKIPAGASGAELDAGWLGAGKVKSTISRAASVVERMFSDGTGTSGNPGDATWLGLITIDDIGRMWRD